jgi:uncharacterized protein (DUF58 family)
MFLSLFKTTKEFRRSVLATFLILIAALNTGNNLIYLILSMMFSLFVISLAVLFINLKRLRLNISVSKPAFARSASGINVSLSNLKKFIPSYSIKIVFPEGIQGSCAIPYIAPSSSASSDVIVTFPKRGAYNYKAFYLRSSYPSIFFIKQIKTYGTDFSITVYPEIKNMDEMIPDFFQSNYSSAITKPGHGDDFLTVREFRYGDSISRIHWKASAKLGKLVSKTMAAYETKLVTIILDNIGPANNDDFEKVVSFAASLAYKFIQSGFLVRLLTCKKIVPFGGGMEHLFKILDLLAVIDEERSWDCPSIEEMHGAGILILKSSASYLKKMESMCNMVIYASDI